MQNSEIQQNVIISVEKEAEIIQKVKAFYQTIKRKRNNKQIISCDLEGRKFDVALYAIDKKKEIKTIIVPDSTYVLSYECQKMAGNEIVCTRII